MEIEKDLYQLILDVYTKVDILAWTTSQELVAKYQTYNDLIKLLHEVYPTISHENATKEAWYYWNQRLVSDEEDRAMRQLEEWKILSEGSKTIVVDKNSVEFIDTENDEDKPSKTQLYNLSNYLRDDLQLLKKFEATYVNKWGWLMWLQDNLPSDTFCIYNTEDNRKLPILSIHLQQKSSRQVRVAKNPTRKHLYIDRSFFKILDRCKLRRPSLRFVVGILALPQHDNALVFDFDTRRIVRFEPHGGAENVMYRPGIIDDAIVYALIEGKGQFEYFPDIASESLPFSAYEKEYFKDWTYVSPTDFCPNLGPQAIENRSNLNFRGEYPGYCLAWSMIFMQQRVMQPEKSESEIVEYFTQQTPNELRILIRNYATYMMGLVDRRPELFVENLEKDSLQEGDYVYYIRYWTPVLRGRVTKICDNGKALVKPDKTWSRGAWAAKRVKQNFDRWEMGIFLLKKITKESIKKEIDKGLSSF